MATPPPVVTSDEIWIMDLGSHGKVKIYAIDTSPSVQAVKYQATSVSDGHTSGSESDDGSQIDLESESSAKSYDESADNVIGTCSYEARANGNTNRPDHRILSKISVKANYRRMGIATQMVRFAQGKWEDLQYSARRYHGKHEDDHALTEAGEALIQALLKNGTINRSQLVDVRGDGHDICGMHAEPESLPYTDKQMELWEQEIWAPGVGLPF
ncbi:hypothetical protein HKX48_006429 [Thoreauomyces humboldtii]|nr:hypothetical protein HKX48_006429 [Thoreauomyces humboldtii]